MNIGIYGDSYADPKKNNPTKTWMELIGEKYGEITSYAENGSNLFFSINNFENNHRLHNKNIFMVTAPFRLWADRWNVEPIKHTFLTAPQSVETYIEFHKEFSKGEEQVQALKVLEATNIYFSYIQNIPETLYTYRLMLKNLIEIDPQVILIPCYSDSDDIINLNGNLLNIFLKENKAWSLDTIYSTVADKRNNHLTKENHAILAQLIIDYIEEGKPIDLNENNFVAPSLESKSFYIK